MANPSNPYKANQHKPDPRQAIMWQYYLESILNGQKNAKEAAKKAGYSDAEASAVTVRSWFIARNKKLRRKQLVDKSEEKFEQVLTLPAIDQEGKPDVPLLRVQTDVAKYVTSTQGKKKGYTTKTETDITTDGKGLPATINIITPHGSDISTIAQTVGGVATTDGQNND